MQVTLDPKSRGQREQFYASIAPHSLKPLWEVLGTISPPQPSPKAQPFCWRYKDVRPLMLEAGSLLTAQEAERRVLVMENPAYPGLSRATASLFAGMQMILPGETAPAHRHTPSALRLLIDGDGGFTSVGGERTVMREGDFVITPAWAWHDHGNDGDGPVMWLDGLDIPMLGFFESAFTEMHEEQSQELSRPSGDSIARYGNGLVPMNDLSPYGKTSPIFSYPYERTRESLVVAEQGASPDPHLATTLRFSNPLDGGWSMPTIATWITYLKAGEHTIPIRSTDSMVMSVVEGSGRVSIGDAEISFEAKDTVAFPGWHWRSFTADTDCFLFFFSDRVVHEKLGFYREQKQPA